MALPTSYLTSTRNLEAFLNALRSAKAPDKFTTRFLEALDFKSSSDRLFIGVLKSLGFLDGDGKPQDRYFRFLDQTKSAVVLAEAIQESYSDLFQINKLAYTLNKSDIVNKMKTLSQGQLGESVLDKAAMTFLALAKHADFSYRPPVENNDDAPVKKETNKPEENKKKFLTKLKMAGVLEGFTTIYK